jgi:hypothetical protein
MAVKKKAKVVKKGKVRKVTVEPGIIIPIEKGEIVVIDEKEIPPSNCKCEENTELLELNERVRNLYSAVSELISLTGTGRILQKYNIKPYDLTKEDLERGQYKPK